MYCNANAETGDPEERFGFVEKSAVGHDGVGLFATSSHVDVLAISNLCIQ